ncbi:MAG TPA: hypothetical protein PLU06_06135 [Candidatus Syntrophosphaera sp.]|nr:hypothetical protein [Candidatus Syntrophosphaera sp.]HRQ67898.1 hypothetical protein [Candidatus Syntrophosphaera sp.]
MKKIAFLLILALLALLAGCSLFCPEDEPSGWIEIDGQDFPVYVGHFADYEHTDANGTSLGTVAYGEDGDANDWQIFAYDPSSRGSLPKMGAKAGGARDEYHILVRAFCEYNGSVELNAAIYYNGKDTGFFTPHSFSYQGAYDPALEDSFLVSHPDYEFLLVEPEVSFAPETNTYSYVFHGNPIIIPPPWDPFIVILDEQGHVLLRWITYSETNMLGFRLHRSDTNDFANAQVINPELIPATNTSEQHDYSYTDVNVSPGHTYYYWLERVFDGADSYIYGPCSVTTPPAVNRIAPAYPNPCRNYFYLPLDVKFESGATILLLGSQYTVRKKDILGAGCHNHYLDVHNFEPGLYRVFVWFHDGHYSYGDVLVEE